MTIHMVLNAPALRHCIESPRSVGEWWACCPECDRNIGDDKRRMLIRSYSNNSVSVHCLKQCPEWVILDVLDLTMDARRGDDGQAPPVERGWWRTTRRHATLARPMGQQ